MSGALHRSSLSDIYDLQSFFWAHSWAGGPLGIREFFVKLEGVLQEQA